MSRDRPVNAYGTTPAPQRNPPRILRTTEPRGCLGQEASYTCLHPEMILAHRATYTNTTRSELLSQECLHTCEYRKDQHFSSNSWTNGTSGKEPRIIWGQDPSGYCLHSRADLVPQLSIPKFLLERTGLPGVLTYRLAGQTSHNQRQLDQLRPEITSWQKARSRTLARETKATCHQHNPVLPPQRALDTPNR